MKSKPINHAAFTRTELLVLVAVIAFASLLPGMKVLLKVARSNQDSGLPRFVCAANLKQIGLAFRVWAEDNEGRYPMSVYTNAAGEQLFANAALAYRYFQVMSNESNDPRVLICPEDKKHQAATNFDSDFNNHISYFIGLDADEQFPQRFLAGDTHLTNGTPLKNGILELTPSHPADWTAERHEGVGDIAMADGSVLMFDTLDRPKLRKFTQTTNITERLLLPDAGETK